MGVRDNGQQTTRQAGGLRLAWLGRVVLVVLVLILLAFRPAAAAADGTPDQPVAHSVIITLAFPDSGLQAGEQLCLTIYPDSGSDLAAIPALQSRCMGPGANQVIFDGLVHGPYVVAVPAPDSVLLLDRYQGQLVRTEVPDDPQYHNFGVDITLSLTPEMAGTTGSIQVNVYGCPPGTNGGGDATLWQSECTALVAEVPVTLAGLGSIEDMSMQAVTELEGDNFGRVQFTNLPAGAYLLESALPSNIAESPAYFVGSSITGGLAPLDPSEPVAVRPAEVVTIDVYLVLDPRAGPAASSPSATLGDPVTENGLPPTADAGIGDPTTSGNGPVMVSEPEVIGSLTTDPVTIATPGATPEAGTDAEVTRPWITRLPATGSGHDPPRSPFEKATAAVTLMVTLLLLHVAGRRLSSW